MRPSGPPGVILFVILVTATNPGLPARGDELAGEVKELRDRLAALEKKLERVLERNQELETRLADPRPHTAAAPVTIGDPTPANSEEVRRIVADYLSERDAAKAEAARNKSFEVGKHPRSEVSWRNGFWTESADGAFKLNVGGVTQFDMGWYGARQPLVRSIGLFNNYVDPNLALSDGMDMRRARIRFAGTLWEQIELFAQYDFAQSIDLRRRTLGLNTVDPPNTDIEPAESIVFNEVYIGFTKIPVLGNIRVGRHRESLNFVTATADNTQVWMERGLLFDAFNGDFNFSNGITVQNTYLDDRLYAYAGWFQNNLRNFSAVGDGEYAYDGRLTGLPIWSEENELWVHVGGDYSYRNLHLNEVRYRARPLIRTGNGFQVPNLLNTGLLFSRDAQQIANLEFASAWGRWTFAAEACASWVPNAFTGGLPGTDGTLPKGVKRAGNYFSEGAYVELLYFLTPDHRGYQKNRPGYARVIPSRTFYFLEGENGLIRSLGAWEVGVRYDYLDLTDKPIDGGMSNAMTFALNWYLNPNTRVQWNYFIMDRRFATVGDARLDGEVQGLGVRFNLDF